MEVSGPKRKIHWRQGEHREVLVHTVGRFKGPLRLSGAGLRSRRASKPKPSQNKDVYIGPRACKICERWLGGISGPSFGPIVDRGTVKMRVLESFYDLILLERNTGNRTWWNTLWFRRIIYDFYFCLEPSQMTILSVPPLETTTKDLSSFPTVPRSLELS